MLETAGWPETKGALHQVASRLGLHDMTLSRWARRQQNPAPHQMVIDKKLELTEVVDFIFGGFASELIARISNGDLIDEQTATLLTGLGISFDKHQLLTGGATERAEVRGIHVIWDDRERSE